jgi:acylphosphatase
MARADPVSAIDLHMSAIIARRCRVSGRVQGVFYRASARQKAGELGVSGHAHNMPDGSVDVLVVGEPAAAQSFIEWLRHGPPAAHVSNVEISELDVASLGSVPQGFATR